MKFVASGMFFLIDISFNDQMHFCLEQELNTPEKLKNQDKNKTNQHFIWRNSYLNAVINKNQQRSCGETCLIIISSFLEGCKAVGRINGDQHSGWADKWPSSHSSNVIKSRQSKEAINSVWRRGLLVAKEFTFTFVVPSKTRQDVMVALQHSRTHGGTVVALQMVSFEQSAQPAVHDTVEPVVVFFS